jgi:hypothetical protein
MQMNKGLPAIKRTVHAEEFKWVLALWALRGLLVGCPPQNARHAAYRERKKIMKYLGKEPLSCDN